MTVANYKPSLALTLAHEGGYVNHPKDPGGPTNRGVTQRVYDAYRKVKGRLSQSVKAIEPEEVEDIYRRQYWNLIRGDDLPAGLDYAVFDFAVNSGVYRASRYLQRVIRMNDDDGVLGMLTLSVVLERHNAGDTVDIISKLCANRMAFLKSLSTFPTFGTGWTRRVMGRHEGFQAKDNGVIDFATVMTGYQHITQMPKPVGELPEEVAGKGFSADYASWPVADQNDWLADMIAKS